MSAKVQLQWMQLIPTTVEVDVRVHEHPSFYSFLLLAEALRKLTKTDKNSRIIGFFLIFCLVPIFCYCVDMLEGKRSPNKPSASEVISELQNVRSIFEADSSPLAEAAIVRIEALERKLGVMPESDFFEDVHLRKVVASACDGVYLHDDFSIDTMVRCASLVIEHFREKQEISLSQLRSIMKDLGMLGNLSRNRTSVQTEIDILRDSEILAPTDPIRKNYSLGKVGKELFEKISE